MPRLMTRAEVIDFVKAVNRPGWARRAFDAEYAAHRERESLKLRGDHLRAARERRKAAEADTVAADSVN